MEVFNFINSKTDFDKPVYRIIPFDRLMESIEEQINVLVRPRLWDDPFENMLSHFNTNIFASEKYYIYAQCWSFSAENDLLWRTYSQQMDCVRVRSTPRKLIQSIQQSISIKNIDDNPYNIHHDMESGLVIKEEISTFCGKVKYLEIENISRLLKNVLSTHSLSSYLETLLVKREAFRNEEEFRFGIRHFFSWNDDFLQLSGDIFKYDFDVNSVFEEVVFDPRISKNKFEGLKNQIEKHGFKNPILKSNLYDKPELELLK